MDKPTTARSRALPVGDYVRQVRRVTDMSQRELARMLALSLSSIARLEAGSTVPRLNHLELLLAFAGWRLAVLDDDRREVHPLLEYDADLRDGADRRFPAHLDVIVEPEPGEWWGDQYGLARPPETFRRDRSARDRQRALSQYGLGRSPRRSG
jgi:transcriptional regulator with XRE-family HTH domain